jgi:hypothetical protein
MQCRVLLSRFFAEISKSRRNSLDVQQFAMQLAPTSCLGYILHLTAGAVEVAAWRRRQQSIRRRRKGSARFTKPLLDRI